MKNRSRSLRLAAVAAVVMAAAPHPGASKKEVSLGLLALKATLTGAAGVMGSPALRSATVCETHAPAVMTPPSSSARDEMHGWAPQSASLHATKPSQS